MPARSWLLLGMFPVLELSKNPCYFLKLSSSSLAIIWCQPGLEELLLSGAVVAIKLPHLLKMKTNQKSHLSCRIQSKDTGQQYKQSPCMQANKDDCQGLRQKKWHSCSTALVKLYETLFSRMQTDATWNTGCLEIPHTHTQLNHTRSLSFLSEPP